MRPTALALLFLGLAACGGIPAEHCPAEKDRIVREWGGPPDKDGGMVFTYVDVPTVTYRLSEGDDGSCVVKTQESYGVGEIGDMFPDED
jgi:hypothetical protein